jgi:ADP-dependent NAD(P)H-hydrate dehydratase / NAD(P)H-hydrate epimerase
MKSLLSCSESGRLDATTATRAAIPPILLMEDASVGLWRVLEPFAKERVAGGSGLLVALCGPGNNGGDALALLRHARFSGLGRLAAILVKEVRGEPGKLYEASLSALSIPVLYWDREREGCEAMLAQASLIVDGLSGTGLRGALREDSASLAAAALASGAEIASIDLPSGLSDSFEAGFPLVKATWTLSIEPRKACLYFPRAREYCGVILPVDGVFPDDAGLMASTSLLEEEDLNALAPLPPDSAYKGERGRVAVFAGSVGASGAAVLASKSCLAAGAGLVSLFASAELYPIVAPMLDAVMVKPEPGIGDLAGLRCDSLLIGPGWGRGAGKLEYLAALLESGLPAVIDADAIAPYRALVDRGFSATGPILLTPHPGEFASLTGIAPERALANPAAFLPGIAASLKAVVILKSQVTWIAEPGGQMAVWEGMESGLGTAGSGDVLAGLATGLLARLSLRGGCAFSAARAAVIAHGTAGRRARIRKGWFEASSLIEEAALILGGRDRLH